MRYTFDESGVIGTTPIGEDKLKWDAFKKWRKVAGCYVIYLSKVMFIAIPYTSIPVEDIPVFESLLRNHIKSKSH